MWWHMAVMLVLRKLRQDVPQFEVSPDYIARPYLKN